MQDCIKTIVDQLTVSMIRERVPNESISKIRNEILIVLDEYEIEPKGQSIVVWTEHKNDTLLRKFLLSKMAARCSDGTIKNYRNEISRALYDIGKDADTMTALDIQIYLAKRVKSTESNSSYPRTIYRYLSSFFSFLVKERLIKENPMDGVESIRIEQTKKTAFTDMEVEKLRSGCNTSMERAIVEVLSSTGCRISELSSMRIRDLRDDSIDVVGKGNKERTLYLNAKAKLAIQEYVNERKDSSEWLFPKMNKDALKQDTVSFVFEKHDWFKYPELIDEKEHRTVGATETMLKRLGRRVGVLDVHPHRFRRTFATNASRRGVPIEQIKKMMGHSQISTTQIYLDISDDDVAQSHRILLN